MKRFLSHPLFLSSLVIAALYVFFADIMVPPVPLSLLIQYLVICIIGVLLVATVSDDATRRLGEPIRTLLGNPGMKIPRAIAFVVLVLGSGGITYNMLKQDLSAPVELRTIHPAPPSSLKVYGKTFNLISLENPLSKGLEKGSDEYKKLISEGGRIYYKNCVYCHGDRLNGAGHFAQGFNPRPANFQDVGTIAQLQESFLFWRITTGGTGLPREGTPWASAMPVWHNMLKEDEVWKVISFLYDYTGHVPRSWKLEKSSSKADEKAKAAKVNDGKLSPEQVKAVYMKRCSQCHGENGEGNGVAADRMYPKPRDFTLGVFKYKTSHADDELPYDKDLRKTIMEGLPGTAMPSWKGLLSDSEVNGLIGLIKEFGGWAEDDIEHTPIDMGTRTKSSPESVANGKKIFKKACSACHGETGRGNIISGKKLKDDWRNRIWPRNLTRPSTWRWGTTASDVFQRISSGIRGTPMPEVTTNMSVSDRWDVVNYVMTLRNKSVAFDAANTVIRAARIDGELPTSAGDPAWDKASPVTFPMVPNVIRDPRLFFSLNHYVTVRALFNDKDVVLRMDVDDRTYSVPGDKLEERYRVDGVTPTRDALAVEFPVTVRKTSEKPWFRHGDAKNPVNMWFWRAPSVSPEAPEGILTLDARGPEKAPVPRIGDKSVSGKGVWANGQWRIVMRRSLKTDNSSDMQFSTGVYTPISFANWDGVDGQSGSRHTLTSWYWLLLEPKEDKVALFGGVFGVGLFVGLLFVIAARRQRRHYG